MIDIVDYRVVNIATHLSKLRSSAHHASHHGDPIRQVARSLLEVVGALGVRGPPGDPGAPAAPARLSVIARHTSQMVEPEMPLSLGRCTEKWHWRAVREGRFARWTRRAQWRCLCLPLMSAMLSVRCRNVCARAGTSPSSPAFLTVASSALLVSSASLERELFVVCPCNARHFEEEEPSSGR